MSIATAAETPIPKKRVRVAIELPSDPYYQLITKEELATIIRKSTRHIDRAVESGYLPQPVLTGERSPGWILGEVFDFLRRNRDQKYAR